MGGLVPLLLHLQDPQAPVASVSSQCRGEPGGAWAGRGAQPGVLQACRFALCMCISNLECEELAATFHKHLQEGRSLHFGEFLNSTCKHLVRWAHRGGPAQAGLSTLTAWPASADASLPRPAGTPGEHQPVLL